MRTTHDRTSDPADATTRGQTMKAARHVRSPARRAALAATLVVGGGVPSLTAVGASAVPPNSDPGSSGVVDELVEVGGARLHVHCSGAGDPTVLLIAGFNDGGDNWGAVKPAISRETRVCSYARFGTGASDPPTTRQTFATSARDLHALLSQIEETGPYVVVGHSYGGAQAVTFAEQLPRRGRWTAVARRHACDMDRCGLRGTR